MKNVTRKAPTPKVTQKKKKKEKSEETCNKRRIWHSITIMKYFVKRFIHLTVLEA